MLGNKHRMTAKRGLFAIVGYGGRGKALGNEILSMGECHGQAFALEVSELLTAQLKAAAKGGFGQCSKNFVQVSHTNQLNLKGRHCLPRKTILC